MSVQTKRLRNGAQQRIGHLCYMVDGLDPLEHDDKLVAAEPRDGIALSDH